MGAMAPAGAAGTMTQQTSAAEFARTVERWATEYLKQHHPETAAKSAGRIALAVRQAAAVDENIYKCTAASVARAVAMCVTTGLAPGGALPLVYLIPRNVKNRATGNFEQQLQWQISVRGLETLAHRAGYRVRSVPVFEGDEFMVKQGLRPDITHEPSEDAVQSWETLRGVYVVSHMTGSVEPYAFEWVPLSVLKRLRAASDAATSSYGPWVKWPVEMARARAIGYALRRGVVPMTEDALAEAAAMDAAPVDSRALDAIPLVPPEATAQPARGLRSALGVRDEGDVIDLGPEDVREEVPRAEPAKPEQSRRRAARAEAPASEPAPAQAQAAPAAPRAQASASSEQAAELAQARTILTRAGVSERSIEATLRKCAMDVQSGRAPSLLDAAEMIAAEYMPSGEDMP